MKKFFLISLLLSFSWIAKSQQDHLQELLGRKQYNQIVSYATQLQDVDSADFQTMYLIGQAYEGLLKYNDAFRLYQHCLLIDSTQVELLYTTARVAANLGRMADAESYFLKIWESDTTDFYANYQLARFYVQSDNDEKAIEYYEYLLEHDPDNAILLKAVGDCYYRLDDKFSAAEAYWYAFQNNKNNAGLASALINTLLPLSIENVAEQVLEICDTALLYNPENKKIIQHKGTAFFMGKRYTEADSIFSFLLAEGDSSYYNLKYGGFSKFYAEKYLDSIELLEASYNEDDTAADVCLFLGAAFGRTYDRKRAYELFDRTEELIQPNPAYLNLLTEFRGTTYFSDNRCREGSVLLYPLWEQSKRSDLLQRIWNCYGNADVSKLSNDDERARSMFVNVLMATVLSNSNNISQLNPSIVSFIRTQLEKFRTEMFFRSMKEYPMIAPDNKKSTVSIERLQELIQQLP